MAGAPRTIGDTTIRALNASIEMIRIAALPCPQAASRPSTVPGVSRGRSLPDDLSDGAGGQRGPARCHPADRRVPGPGEDEFNRLADSVARNTRVASHQLAREPGGELGSRE